MNSNLMIFSSLGVSDKIIAEHIPEIHVRNIGRKVRAPIFV